MFERIKVYVKVLFHHHSEILAVTKVIQGFKTKNESQRAQLRRNIHRIEKGLIMRPMKKVFAEAYIDETVNLYNLISLNDCVSDSERQWFEDVLNKYFSLVDETHKIKLASSKFHPKMSSLQNNKFIPYPASDRCKSNVKFDDLSTLIKRRRSVRFFNKEKPKLLDIRECIDIASQAPSACNRQPFKVIYTDKDLLVKDIANCAGGTSGYSDNIPSIMVVIGNLEYFNNPFDRHVPYIDSSLFVMQLLLSLETKNLSTCIINWPDYKVADNRIRTVINIKDTERVMMLIAVGKANDNSFIPYSHKKTNVDLLQVIQ